MLAQEKFNQLLKTITPILKQYRYSKGGTVFRRRQGDNWGVIGFLKDKWNTKDSVRFNIEIGVYSLAIDKQLDWKTLPKKPSTPYCHWRKHLYGNVKKPGFELWWDVNQSSSIEELTEQVKTCLLDRAIPEIDERITDEQLKVYWLSGGVSGISEFVKLRQLSILLKLSGERDQLDQVLQQIEQKYRADNPVFVKHMQKMRSEIPEETETTIKQGEQVDIKGIEEAKPPQRIKKRRQEVVEEKEEVKNGSIKRSR